MAPVAEATADAVERGARGGAPDTLYIAVFGTLWGLLEITLGTALKSLRIPFTGLLMASLAAVIFLSGRRFTHRRGAILMMGGVAALLKIFSMGGFVLGPFWAILFEALIAEAVILTLGYRRVTCALAGILVVAYTTVHPFIAQTVLYGSGILQIYLEMLQLAGRVLGLEHATLLMGLGAWLAVVAVLGTAAGLAGHALGRAVEARVQRVAAERRAAA
jgi:hypothetical protein